MNLGKILAVSFVAFMATFFVVAAVVQLLLYLYGMDIHPPVSREVFIIAASGVFSWFYWQMWKRAG